MAKHEIRNGQAEYGTRHVMEDEMREAAQGVFEAKSAGAAPRNKARTTPANKSLDDMTKAELLEEAERRSVGVSSGDTKAEILSAIKKG